MTSIDLRKFARQRGNTLTGVIIGLIVGLVIAVIVALAITKGSTPFTDKTGKQGKMGETTAGQAADPNKPLYSNKEAALKANKEFTGKKGSDDPLGDAVAAMDNTAAPAVKPIPPALPLPAATPVAPPARPAEAKVVAAVAADEPDEKIIYFLQAGAFREIDDAENTRAKLALLGFEAAISEKANDSGILYRVRIGPFPQVETMNKARAKLIDSGIDVAIVKNQK
ncbi:MAG: SPOR domain-containing protein [Pseudomonadota bacterium]